jgi:MoaA/NifB/PqqE/SkfB family radical SAM enzyme
MLKKIKIPEEYNYIGAFLTFSCNLTCSYCINLNESGSTRKSILQKSMSGADWVRALNRLEIKRDDLPITLQGGEPTVHKDFLKIVQGVNEGTKLDLLTNMVFDIDKFIAKVNPKKFTREAKYAAIRVSYHPGQNDIKDLIAKTKKMAKAGIYVGIYSVMVPQNKDHIEEVKKRCLDEGIDFRVKEYLGFDGQKWHGTYKYPEAISQKVQKYCECKTTELIISPSGHVFRCHSDLYENRTPIGHILDPDFDIDQIYRPCYVFGHCNPCDIKVKTNRHQIFGHTSVDIKNIRDLNSSEMERLLQYNDNGLGEYDYERDRKFLNG